MCKFLESQAYQVIIAESGEKALALYREFRPDVVLMDYFMPDLDGIAVYKLLQSRYQEQLAPIIMITTSDNEAAVEEAFTVGMTDFITKPIHWTVLKHRLQRILAARQSEAFAQSVIAYSAVGIITVDEEGSIQFANTAVTKMFDYLPAQLAGSDITRLLPGLTLSDFCGNNSRYPSKREDRTARRRDGAPLPVECVISPFMIDGNCWVTIFVSDVTERRQAEEAVRESEARLRTITESAKDAIIMMDPQGRTSYWNAAAEHLLGYSRTEALGRDLHQLIAPDRYLAIQQAAFAKFQQSGQGNAVGTSMELEACHKDGREIAVEVSLSSLELPDGWHSVGILRDISERKQMESQIRHLATHDALTGLPGRVLAHDRLAMAISLPHRALIAVMFVDLDNFKNVNDTFGHSNGDYVLRHVAKKMRSSLRDKDTLARVGGDEFLVIATDLRSQDDAAIVAKKIISVVTEPIQWHGGEAVVGASIGISLYPSDATDLEELIQKADAAMYNVKKTGKNGYRFAAQ